MHLRPVLSFCSLLAASGCHLILGSEDFTNQSSGGAGGAGAAGGAGGSGNGMPTGGNPPTDGGGGAGASTNEGGMTNGGGGEGGAGGGPCEGFRVTAPRSVQDLVVMLDSSGSMTDLVLPNGTRFGAQAGAVQDFVSLPATAGTTLAVGFFPVLIGGSQPSCDVDDYSTPVIDFTPAPGVNGQLATELVNHMPDGSSTLGEPMQGAIEIATVQAQMFPQHFVTVVVITDAEPNMCEMGLPALTAIAASGFAGDPSVQTFIIGMESGTPDLLDQISAAGNGGPAYLIPEGDTNPRLTATLALRDIRSKDQFCGLDAPEGDPDPNQVNLLLTDLQGKESIVPHVPDLEACPEDDFAWYYDSVGRVRLCGDYCNSLFAPDQGTLEFLLGCDTIESP